MNSLETKQFSIGVDFYTGLTNNVSLKGKLDWVDIEIFIFKLVCITMQLVNH